MKANRRRHKDGHVLSLKTRKKIAAVTGGIGLTVLSMGIAKDLMDESVDADSMNMPRASATAREDFTMTYALFDSVYGTQPGLLDTKWDARKLEIDFGLCDLERYQRSVWQNQETGADIPYGQDMGIIIYTGQTLGKIFGMSKDERDLFTAAILAARKTEKGSPGRETGILAVDGYKSTYENDRQTTEADGSTRPYISGRYAVNINGRPAFEEAEKQATHTGHSFYKGEWRELGVNPSSQASILNFLVLEWKTYANPSAHGANESWGPNMLLNWYEVSKTMHNTFSRQEVNGFYDLLCENVDNLSSLKFIPGINTRN